MVAKWVRFCQRDDLDVVDSMVEVRFGERRRQRVSVEEHDDEYLLRSFVVRQPNDTSMPDLPVRIWERNRATALVGFRIDGSGCLVGECWVPKAGLLAKEFRLYVRMVAEECDRLEFVLTGSDVE